PDIVRALMNYGLAESVIDSDRLPAVIDRINGISRDARLDSVTRAMTDLLQAQIYFDIYTRDRWKYDRRELPETPVAADCREWSGQQFRIRIDSLVAEALKPAVMLRNTPITTWQNVVRTDNTSEPCFPTIYDFVAYKAINMYGTTATDNNKAIALLHSVIACATTPAPAIYGKLRLMTLQPEQNTWDAAKALLYQYISEPYSALIIQHMAGMDPDIPQRKWLYATAENWLGTMKNAHGDLRKGMQTVKRNMIAAKVKMEFTRAISPDTPLDVKIHAECTNSCRLLVFSLPAGWTADKASMYTQISATQVKLTGSGVFECDTIVPIKLPGYGCYAIVPVMTTNDIKNARINDNKIVSVTSLGLMGTAFGKRTQIIVADATNGAPVKGATVNVAKTRREPAVKSPTDRRGISEFTRHFDYGNTITATLGKDTRTPEMHVWNYMSTDNTDNSHLDAQIFTSLAIYRPGDKVDFAGVVYRTDAANHTLHVAAHTRAAVVLTDANHQQVDTIELTTDEFGRIESTFILPKDGLTGNYGIHLYSDSRSIGNSYFTVSDYKMPTFEITSPAIERGVPAKGDVRITATARTYSGFPLEGAHANVELRASDDMARWWWYHDRGHSFHTQDTVTGSNGQFVFEFSDSLLNSAPGRHRLFTAIVTVTAANGETHSEEVRFSQGKQYCIIQSLSSDIAIQGSTLRLPLRSINLQGNDVNLRLRYTLKHDSVTVNIGEIDSATPVINTNGIPSGKYSITFAPTDSTLADPVTADNIILFRTTDKLCPVDEVLWIPQCSRPTATKGEKYEILYGTTAKDLNMLCTVWTDDSILSQKWIHAGEGMHRLGIDIPATYDKSAVNVTIMAINGYQNYRGDITIEVTNVADYLNIEIESMRSRITPGSTERWTIRVTDNCNVKRSAALMMRMYATALDKLATNRWTLNPIGIRGNTLFNFSSDLGGRQHVWINAPKQGSNSYISIIQPAFQTYSMQFGSQYYGMANGIRVRGTKMSSTAMMKMDYAAGAVLEEAAVTMDAMAAADSGIAEAEDTSTESDSTESDTADEYRVPEVPLAFFRPMLTTNADGILEFSFTAPQA
ncbi:MAG: hypothetical protein K2M76_00160, partial [Muribaculaceae bacterium]|nr:hypothetical protein [Muribaculaceae bacterium]